MSYFHWSIINRKNAIVDAHFIFYTPLLSCLLFIYLFIYFYQFNYDTFCYANKILSCMVILTILHCRSIEEHIGKGCSEDLYKDELRELVELCSIDLTFQREVKFLSHGFLCPEKGKRSLVGKKCIFVSYLVITLYRQH